MFHNEGRVFAASTAGYGVSTESIRCDVPRAGGGQGRSKARPAVTICVFANRGGLRA
jgi:hypothetical protein